MCLAERTSPCFKTKPAKLHSELECVDDPLLTRIHEAIRAKSAPDYNRSGKEVVDLIELESEWLGKDLDLQRLLDSDAVTIQDLSCLLDVLSNAFPLPRFLAVEQKPRRDPADRRARRARDSLDQRYLAQAIQKVARKYVYNKRGEER